MNACSWIGPRGGCHQKASEGDLCYFHAKVAGGLITDQRGESLQVVPIAMTTAQRQAANRARDSYYEALAKRHRDSVGEGLVAG